MTKSGEKTYLDVFRESKTERELVERIKHEVKVALFLGGNPDRLKAIENAMNTVAEEKGWELKEMR